MSEITAIWNRRPGRVFENLSPKDRPTDATAKFVAEQWFSWLEALQLRQEIRWVNHPTANAIMENKLRQLQLAVDVGFAIPETIVTNCSHEVQAWRAKIDGDIVCKALYSPLIEEQDHDYFIFTNLFDELPEDFADSLALAPTIFQQAIIPKVDYRVTVVGSQVLSVQIDLANPSLDWRTVEAGITFQSSALPTAVEERCRRYVKEAGLSFGAIDLVRFGDDFIFLEINPNGEWGWLERPHGVPVSSALCDLLTGSTAR